MRIALYQEFGEGCRRLTHELLPAAAGWELVEAQHVGVDVASLAAEDAATIRSAEVVIATPLSPLPDAIYDPDGRVRLIQLLSAGYDTIDLDRCRALGNWWPPTAAPTPWPWPSTRFCSSSRCSGVCR